MKKLFIVFCLTSISAVILSQIQVEVYGGLGFTGVDVESWYGGSVEDWVTLNGEGYVAVFPVQFGSISVGGEIGYQYLFWYSVPVFGYSWVYEYNVDAIRIMGLLRTQVGSNAFAEAGAGVFLISDWVSPGIMAALGYRIRLNEKLSIPIKIRSEFVAGDNLFVVGLNGGISYAF